MPDSRPDTAFTDGICSACIAFERRAEVDWEARREALLRILESRGSAEYTCIVPSSGGKDSHWQVITLLELGARPLVVTATTCHLTPIGRRNIDNLTRFADTIEVTPNRTIRAKLNRLALEWVGDISWSEHVLIHTVPFRVALDMRIPLVFYGENPLAEYGGPSWELQSAQRMTRRWVAEFGGFLGLRPADLVGKEGITDHDMRPYIGPMDGDLRNAGIDVYFLGSFFPWDSRRNAEVAITNGFEAAIPCTANWWEFENLDNAQTGVHDHFMWLKYGYGRSCAQLSVDIRHGRISREKAMLELKKKEGLFPFLYAGVSWSDMIERIGLSRERFSELMEDYASSQGDSASAQAR